MKNTSISLFFIYILFFTACGPKNDGDIFDRSFSGEANFSRFIVVGDGFSGGYMDGALYQTGQDNSIGNLLAQQAALTLDNPLPFLQPDIQSEVGFGGYDEENNPLGKWVLKNVDGFDTPLPVRSSGTPPSFYTEDPAFLGNFAVPEAKVLDALVPGYGQDNIFYGRFASSIQTSTIIGDAVDANPTFFLFWMGYRDILNYAMSGATGVDGGTGTNDMTSVENFRVAYQAAINSLLSTGASGTLVNFPDIIHLPFFNTLPTRAVYTTTQDSVDLWNQYFEYNIAAAGWNTDLRFQGLTDEEIAERERPIIIFEDEGMSPVVIEDPSLVDASIIMPNGSFYTIPKIRQLRATEMLLLSFPFEEVENGMGTTTPLPKRHALSDKDIERIRQRIDDFNRIIQDIVNDNPEQLTLINIRFDVRELFGGFPNNINGTLVDASIQPNLGLFSADGVHFNPRGNAHFTNKIIEAINQLYRANLFFLEADQYKANDPAL